MSVIALGIPIFTLSLFGSQLGIRKAILSTSNFNRADLRDSDLRELDLRELNLIGANLCRVNLSGTDLSGANLKDANLSGAIFRDLDFNAALLRNIILTGANLSEVVLSEIDLSKAMLQNANLKAARLINTKLDGANLTGACLWETQRAGWSIKGVICEYAYWDIEGKEKTEYALGEFERLFAEQTKIRLFYKDGISPLEIATLPALIQHLSISYPNCNLRFVSLYEDSGGAVVELAIEDKDGHTQDEMKQLQAALEAAGKEIVEYQRLALAEKESRLRLEGRFEQLNTDFDKLIQRPNFTIQSMRDFDMSDDKGNKYINKGQVGAMGDNAQAHNNKFNQIVNEENSEVKTQVQGDRNVTIGGNVSGSSIITGDGNKNKKD